MLFDKDNLELMDSVVIYAFNNGSNWYGGFADEQNKPSYIHRLIYESNYGKIEEGFVIDHISGISLDNRKVPYSINSLNKKVGILVLLNIAIVGERDLSIKENNTKSRYRMLLCGIDKSGKK